jgi:hypothetical protein
VLVGIAIVLLVWGLGREGFAIIGTAVDEKTVVQRPTLESAVWRSKIDASSPIGGNDEDYVRVLQQFYDTVYAPLPTPKTLKESAIDAFLASAALPAGVDKASLHTIISDAFRATSDVSAAARELKQIQFQPSSDIEPEMGVDQVFNRTEDKYTPAEQKGMPLPEGEYQPIAQQAVPRHAGSRDYKTTSWRGTRPYDVCESGDRACTENVL